MAAYAPASFCRDSDCRRNATSRRAAVSRPVVREAMIALEIGGLIEVRTGAGAFVREQPAEPAAMVNSGHSPSDILSARICVRCWR